MTGEIPSKIIAGISFIGRGGGQVKGLAGFKKGHHTLPDAANAVTQAFLGKICEGELKERAEKLYQAVRAGLGYRRTELSLHVASPRGMLTAKDFDVEIFYELEPMAPSRYANTTVLQHLKNAELARTEEFSRIFSAAFTELSFELKKGAGVETVVDLIERLERDGLTVDYPSDCRECRISVEGVDAHVRYSGASLEMIFPRAGSPRELMQGFADLREAFAVSDELVALIG